MMAIKYRRGREVATDRLLQLRTAWRREAAAVQRAYDRWTSAQPETRDLAYAGYVGALDQEEHAANGYRMELARLPPSRR